MKTLTTLVIAVTAFSSPLLHAAESTRTADGLLTTPSDYEGKQVTLDVAFVEPVNWKSPVAELAFFHAITVDRNDHKRGGDILVVIPSAEASAFSKKYGTDFDGRYDNDPLSGTFLASPGRGPRAQIWMIDTTGKVTDLIKNNKLEIDEQHGPGAGPRGPGPGERQPRERRPRPAAQQ